MIRLAGSDEAGPSVAAPSATPWSSPPRCLAVDRPRPSSLTALLLEAPCPAVSVAGLLRARCRIEDAVSGVAGAPPLHIDRFRLGSCGPGPTVSPGRPFVPGPATLRRAVGLDAVDRCHRGRVATPAAAVADVLAGAADTGHGAPWWAPAWAALDTGSRAAVQAAAVAWASRLWCGLDWAALGPSAVVATRGERWRCRAADWLTVHGRVDVRVGGAHPAGDAWLVVLGGVAPEHWLPLLGLPALVAALSRGPAAAAGRVVGWWPDTDQVRVCAVDDATVQVTAGAVAAVAEQWWRAERPVPGGPARPGGHGRRHPLNVQRRGRSA